MEIINTHITYIFKEKEQSDKVILNERKDSSSVSLPPVDFSVRNTDSVFSITGEYRQY